MKYPFVKDTQLKSKWLFFISLIVDANHLKKDVQQINIISIITSRPRLSQYMCK